ncbi:MAG: bifunctional DNA-formamidopyrimidine glycosylase/DNA-(apurinic or apyrimidinic site) lyase [Tepidisphaeraceae bacterium]
MPELPEVETVVRTLRPHLTGRSVMAIQHLRADMLRPAGFDLSTQIVGRPIAGIVRRAKRIVFNFSNGQEFYIHLGMTGRLSVEDTAAPLVKHTHLLANLDNGRQLRFVDPRRFGEIVWLGGAGHVGVGPEPLGLKAADLLKQLRRTGRPIKAALLDQGVIAGIGNIYADEALHRAALHPLRPANTLNSDEVGRLNRAIKQVLNQAIKAGGSSIRDYVNADGDRGAFQVSHKVYDREGEPCRGCRGLIVRIVLGGRSTHFCPTCQPEVKL